MPGFFRVPGDERSINTQSGDGLMKSTSPLENLRATMSATSHSQSNRASLVE